MNLPARLHNNPPDPIDEAVAPFSDAISEAENWLDGTPVETEAQMKAVDAIIKEIRSARSALDKAKRSETAPLYDAWKAEVARWKPTEDDLDRIQKGLAAAVDGFKRKLAAEKEAARRAAFEEAERKRREAEEAARRAAETDLEAQRAAAEAAREAAQAQKMAQAAQKDTVKGMRTVTRWEVTDTSDLLRWINKNDRSALDTFCDDYARRVHRDGVPRPGLRVWQEKEAF